jgi:transposase-like protein
MKHTQETKERAVRALQSESREAVMRKYGIASQTLYNWQNAVRKGGHVIATRPTDTSSDELSTLRNFMAEAVANEIRKNGIAGARKFFS